VPPSVAAGPRSCPAPAGDGCKFFVTGSVTKDLPAICAFALVQAASCWYRAPHDFSNAADGSMGPVDSRGPGPRGADCPRLDSTVVIAATRRTLHRGHRLVSGSSSR